MLICFNLLFAGSSVVDVRSVVSFCRGTRSFAEQVWSCGFPRGLWVLVWHLGRVWCVMPQGAGVDSGRGDGVGAALTFKGLGDLGLDLDLDLLPSCIYAWGGCSSR